MDLGADTWQTFRYITFPTIRTAILAGGLLAFALSFDEIIVTTFTAGTQETIPIWIFNHLRQAEPAPDRQRRRAGPDPALDDPGLPRLAARRQAARRPAGPDGRTALAHGVQRWPASRGEGDRGEDGDRARGSWREIRNR